MNSRGLKCWLQFLRIPAYDFNFNKAHENEQVLETVKVEVAGNLVWLLQTECAVYDCQNHIPSAKFIQLLCVPDTMGILYTYMYM